MITIHIAEYFIGLKQLVKIKNDEKLQLQSKVDSLHKENKVLNDTNFNLVKGFDVLENDFKKKLRKLVIFYHNFLLCKMENSG